MDKTKEAITEANKFFETLAENISSKEEKSRWFMELMNHIGVIFKHLRELQTNGTIKDHEFALIYLRQLMSVLSFLIKIFVKEIETEQIFLEARFFVINQIQFCLKGFQDDIMEIKEKNEDNLLGCFIKLVDYALDKVGEIYDSDSNSQVLLNICSDARIIFSELLTHAMVIAQISLTEDNKIIEGSCQSVIDGLEWITKEIAKQNTAMRNLSVQACSDKICILEKKVNTAVLKLTLKVFSEYTELMEKIHKYCFDFSNVEKPIIEFANLVEEHDFQVDRILQIGLFAVSCSTDKMNAVKIRSCLSILEGLESEVIPSFAAVLRKQTKESMNLAVLFKELWLTQVALLQGFVFNVIDPYAFCQLVYEENKEILSDNYRKFHRIMYGSANNATESKNFLSNVEYIKKIISNTKLLLGVIDTVKEEQDSNDFKKAYQNCKNVFNEVKWVYFLLCKEKTSENYSKLWKRCKILQTTISVLKDFCLNDDTQISEISEVSKGSLLQRSPLSKDPIMENPFLCHIINRGRGILKDRSNVHLNSQLETSLKRIQDITNNKMKNIEKQKKKEMPLSKYVLLRKMSTRPVNNNSTTSPSTSSSTDSNTTKSTDATNYGILEFSDIIMELNNLTESFVNLTSDNRS